MESDADLGFHPETQLKQQGEHVGYLISMQLGYTELVRRKRQAGILLLLLLRQRLLLVSEATGSADPTLPGRGCIVVADLPDNVCLLCRHDHQYGSSNCQPDLTF